MKKKISAIVLAALTLSAGALLSCSDEKGLTNEDIVGYYTAEKLNNLYYYAPDGKVYENESTVSYSNYEVDGDVIRLYADGEENVKYEFDITKTENGMIIGEVVYTKLKDPEEFIAERNKEIEKLRGIVGFYTDAAGRVIEYRDDGYVYENGAVESEKAYAVSSEIITYMTADGKSEMNGFAFTDEGIMVGDTEYTRITEDEAADLIAAAAKADNAAYEADEQTETAE